MLSHAHPSAAQKPPHKCIHFTYAANHHSLDVYVFAPATTAVALIGLCCFALSCPIVVAWRRRQRKPATVAMVMEAELTVGSSALEHGATYPRQKDILDEVHLDRTVDNGRFGKVCLAEWRQGQVAVKVFETANTSSWEHEKMVYETSMFHHDNVLRYLMCGGECIQNEVC